jgi:hypothetical protein
LYSFSINNTRVGPEPATLDQDRALKHGGYGQHTQGGAMEHLAHVVFGDYALDMDWYVSNYFI